MMRKTLFLAFLISIFAFFGCNKDRIILEITAPKEEASFMRRDPIEVKVTATTQKGRIIQVQLSVDDFYIDSITVSPFHFTIAPYTFPKAGNYTIAITAFSSEGVMEADGVHIKITD